VKATETGGGQCGLLLQTESVGDILEVDDADLVGVGSAGAQRSSHQLMRRVALASSPTVSDCRLDQLHGLP
jgi:hypothetical protein